MRIQKVFTELHAEVHSHFSECTFPSREYQEVLIDNAPFLVLSARDLFKVAEEVLLQLVMVEEAELAVDHCLLSAASDEFRFLQHGLVEVSLYSILGHSIQVDTQILVALGTVGTRIANGGIIIQV